MWKLAKYLKPFWKQCTIGPICKLCEAILEILLPTIMAFMVNDGIMKQDMQVVVTLGILMLCMVLIGFGFSMVCQYNAAISSQGFGTNLRNILFTHIASFSYEDVDSFGTASLNNRLTNDINQLQIGVAMLIRLVIRSPFICFGAIFMAFLLDVKLAFILLGTIPFIVIILFLFIKYTTPLYRAYQKKLDRFAVLLDENFAGIRVIRAFVSQRKERTKLFEASDDLQQQMMQVARLSALLNPTTALVVNGAIIFLLWSGVIQIHSGDIAPGTIIAFINYATQILLALVAISNLILIFTKASASAQRVNEVLEHPSSMKDGTLTNYTITQQAICFQDVNFSYGIGAPALLNVQMEIMTGETIGVIGGTGSGKSTLVNLLCRFYDSTRGSIRIFEKPIQTYTAKTIHALLCIVPQVNELFHGTIRENITFGYTNINDSDIQKALEDAQASSFVNQLHAGLDTIVERGGANLSGGQRQRLCIARALLRKSEILIFDDASSALDFQTDANLRQALHTSGKDKTRIFVSQRVGTLLSCDKIMVLHNGRIVGFANHETLYNTCNIYQEICASQHIKRSDK